jgi:glycosyltransferase involved in cell wall biosynthesis/GR25 family glycosyltransferase involved in LPS biosynthesis
VGSPRLGGGLAGRPLGAPEIRCARVEVDSDGARGSVLSNNDSETIPLYCINLARSIDRRERVTRRFASLGLLDRVQFITAVDADSPAIDEHVQRFGLPEPDDRRRAELAVVLSQLDAIRAFVDETPRTSRSAIIFEDDVLLHREWHSRLERVLGNLPATARVCAIAHLPHSGFASEWVGIDPLERNLTPMTPGKAWGSMGYWLSREFAEEILDEFEELAKRPKLISEHLMWRPDGFIAQPPLAIEEGLASTIQWDSARRRRYPWHRAWGVQNYVVVEQDSRLFDLDPDHPPQTICLCMIVRNEGEAIERVANSVKGLIDSWVICDTGSTDGTPDRVREAFDGIPGELFFDAWQDFGTNRTLMIERARGRADYLLLLDADETVHVQGELPRLDGDAYTLLVGDPTPRPFPRLVKSKRRWRYVGATSEYLTCKKKITSQVCPMLVLETHSHNTDRPNKLTRDRALLESAYSRNSSDPHTVFCLAQVYRDLGEDQLAIEFYTRRRMLGGTGEETFYAMFARAELVSKTDWDLGVMLLLKAWEFRPTRVEPLYALLHGLRVRSQFHLGAVIGDWARKIPLPRDALFVRADLYDWRVAYEFSICALRIGEHKRALVVSVRLLKRRLPDDVREQVTRNRAACLAALADRGSMGGGGTSKPV